MNQKIKTIAVLLVLLSVCHGADSQSATFPLDTTYTVGASFEKVRRDYPDIRLAEGMPDSLIAIKQDIVYRKLGERELHLDIYRPKSSEGELRPAILMIHGGGWSSGSRSHMEVMARDLAFSGYVAIPVEYRRSPEAPYPAGLEDLQQAIRWIGEHGAAYGADGEKIVTLGASSGAHMATFLGTTQNDLLTYKSDRGDRIKAVINIDGIVSFVHPEAKYEGNAAARWLGGGRDTHWHNWTGASPLEYVDEQSPPILFVNGSMPRFHAGRDSLCVHYAQYGIYREVFEFADAPHTFWFFHPWYTPMMYRILGFLGRIF